ncbi:uncharacterized protein CEXT_562271 [Caerostris extrusa]|uniref:Uncharacterized protein n=1 Tax=Caerostris extrusa TaxID=172846 RepID=A0AAV4SNX7_CAEEX|nr:uncharacterized protein CEXT_562271 [Caerostris extrusa]
MISRQMRLPPSVKGLTRSDPMPWEGVHPQVDPRGLFFLSLPEGRNGAVKFTRQHRPAGHSFRASMIGERLFLELPRVRLDGGRQAFRRRWGYDMGVPCVPEEDEDSSELSETTSLRDEVTPLFFHGDTKVALKKGHFSISFLNQLRLRGYAKVRRENLDIQVLPLGLLVEMYDILNR